MSWELIKSPWVTYPLAMVGFVVGLAKFLDAVKKIHTHWQDFQTKRSGRNVTDKKLKEDAHEIAKTIIDFVNERQRDEPTVDFNDFHNSTNEMIKYSQESQNIYARDYAAKVNNLRDEFLKIELQNNGVDDYYQHPTNYLGLKALAIGLATLSEKVKNT